jgi:hypothetical protein
MYAQQLVVLNRDHSFFEMPPFLFSPEAKMGGGGRAEEGGERRGKGKKERGEERFYFLDSI